MAEIYSNDYVRIAWEPDNPVSKDNLLHENPEYKFTDVKISVGTLDRRNQTLYSLDIVMIFQRYIQYYIMQCFLPSIMLVLIAWFSFFQNPVKLSGRIGLSITAMLSIMVQFSSVNSNLPKVGFIKGMEAKSKGFLLKQSVFNTNPVFVVMIIFLLISFFSLILMPRFIGFFIGIRYPYSKL